MLVLFVVLLISCQTLVDDGKGKKRVLWIGTSIPEGCTYPIVACRRLGLACINKAIGSSFGVRMSGNHVSGIIVSGGRKILVR